MTSYMLLLIFSKYINILPEKLDRRSFRNFVFLLFIVFSAAPTFLKAHVMGDGGKGFANILLAYYVGRYIRFYKPNKPVKQYIIYGGFSLAICIVLNHLLSILKGGVALYAPFARDCSVFILVASICIFSVFQQLNINSVIVNRLSRCVMGGIYLKGQ